jgi:hypothetical protein
MGEVPWGSVLVVLGKVYMVPLFAYVVARVLLERHLVKALPWRERNDRKEIANRILALGVGELPGLSLGILGFTALVVVAISFDQLLPWARDYRVLGAQPGTAIIIGSVVLLAVLMVACRRVFAREYAAKKKAIEAIRAGDQLTDEEVLKTATVSSFGHRCLRRCAGFVGLMFFCTPFLVAYGCTVLPRGGA